MKLIVKLIQYIQLSFAIWALENEMMECGFHAFALEQSMYQDEKWTHEDLPSIYEQLHHYRVQLEQMESVMSLLLDRRCQLFDRLSAE